VVDAAGAAVDRTSISRSIGRQLMARLLALGQTDLLAHDVAIEFSTSASAISASGRRVGSCGPSGVVMSRS